jgi:hypothetical protein
MNSAFERDRPKIISFRISEDDSAFDRKHGGRRRAIDAFRASVRQKRTDRNTNSEH